MSLISQKNSYELFWRCTLISSPETTSSPGSSRSPMLESEKTLGMKKQKSSGVERLRTWRMISQGKHRGNRYRRFYIIIMATIVKNPHILVHISTLPRNREMFQRNYTFRSERLLHEFEIFLKYFELVIKHLMNSPSV